MLEGVAVTESLESIQKKAHAMWGGWFGYRCGDCKESCYGRSEEWAYGHLLEHLIEKMRDENK